MKKEKSPVLVIFCIFLLSLFIVLPPFFRSMIPNSKENTPDINKNKSNITLLTCNIIFPNELYQVISRTKYVDGMTPTNTLNFTKLSALPQNYMPSEVVPPITAADELTYFKSLPNAQITENGNVTTIVVNNNLITSLPEDTKIKSYLADDVDIQKSAFESLGFKCNKMEG